MGFTPCTTGTVAVFISEGRESRIPVEAWDDEGRPLVAGDTRLVPAEHLKGLGRFAYLDTGRKHVVPGTGWEMVERIQNGDTAEERTVPVVAFVLDAEGHGVPVTADGSGSVEGASITDRLQPIGGWPEFREVKPED